MSDAFIEVGGVICWFVALVTASYLIGAMISYWLDI